MTNTEILSGSNAEQRSNPADSAMTPEKRAREAANAILSDLSDRAGLESISEHRWTIRPDLESIILSAINAQREEEVKRTQHHIHLQLDAEADCVRLEKELAAKQAIVDALYTIWDHPTKGAQWPELTKVFESNRPKK